MNEAMACGLPVISSDAAGCVEDLLEDHWNGRVIGRGDVVRLASAWKNWGGIRRCVRRWEIIAGSVS